MSSSSTPRFTVIGTPFSTFTRTITLALTYKGISFHQVCVAPHSDTAYKNHPFGFLPTLIIHEIDGRRVDLKLRESQAIARYIDRVAPAPALTLADGDGLLIAEQVWEFVSFVGAYGYPAVEKGVVKPRVAAIDGGPLSETEMALGIDHLRRFLTIVEQHMAKSGYVFGDKLTWADLFLYPLLADLRATPEGELLSPRFQGWMEWMDGLDAVEKTREGTLAVGARPP